MSKIRAFMKFPCLPVCLLLACLATAGVAHAEKADRDKPMSIEADALRYDDQKQSSVFTGRVVVTKGSIVIRGAQLTVRQDRDGSQFGTVIGEPGRLAFFRQKREGLDEFMEGEAESIEYDGRADTIKFSSKAQLRRFKGASLNDEMTGGVIQYDNNTDVFTVDGGVARGSPTGSGGRVRAMLTPKPSTTAPGPGNGTTEAVPNTPPPTLRPSTVLGGEKK